MVRPVRDAHGHDVARVGRYGLFPNYPSNLPAGGSGPGPFQRRARGCNGLPGVVNEGLGRRTECRAAYGPAGTPGRVRNQAHMRLCTAVCLVCELASRQSPQGWTACGTFENFSEH